MKCQNVFFVVVVVVVFLEVLDKAYSFVYSSGKKYLIASEKIMVWILMPLRQIAILFGLKWCLVYSTDLCPYLLRVRLTFITLKANMADDKLMIFTYFTQKCACCVKNSKDDISIFFQKIGSDITW